MSLKTFGTRRVRLWFAALLVVGACTAGADKLMGPSDVASGGPAAKNIIPITGFVISQVYGGGGNANSILKNDFIELYNGSSAPISLNGWSVQYSSSAGTTWQVTSLTNVTLAVGQYYLVQEAQGTGGTTALPTPDATATIAMGATGGKVALVHATSALVGNGCPLETDATVIDYVAFGSGANCFEGSVSPASFSGNVTASIRKDFGRQDTNNNSADFSYAAPSPRNTSSAFVQPTNALGVSISPASSTVQAGTPVTFTASATKGGNAVTINSATWTSSNTAVATIDAAGVASTLAKGSATIGVSAVTDQGTVTSTATLNVTAAPATLTVNPAAWSLKVGQTKAIVPTALDADGQPAGTTYSYSSANPAIASVNAAGTFTGVAVGSTTITTTTANGISATTAVTVTPVTGNFSLAGRATPLPVGFQFQVFINTGTDGKGNPITNNSVMTWSSANTSIATVSPAGIVTATGVGSVSITALATSDGVTSASTTVQVNDPTPLSTVRDGHNLELGTPTDADPSDDFIIARRQYTLSYNVSRGTPNWVSWNLDATHQKAGGAGRCNCFSQDPQLIAAGIKAFDTNEWINGGIYSRGHMSPSADWNISDADNAPTFYLTNMIPQNQTANAGAWGDLENHLRDIVGPTTEVYIIAGPIYTRGRTNGQDGFGFMTGIGHIAVPDSMFKVAVIVPDGRAASGITSPSDVQVIAVVMENSVVTTASWSLPAYQSSIAKIQQSTGYDLLNALPEAIQCRLESRNCAPASHITGAGLAGGSEGSQLDFSAATSTDADNDVLAYQWTVNGQPAGSSASLSYTFTQDGSYVIGLTVSDGKGGTSQSTSTVAITNVAPSVSAISGATIDEGSSFSSAGSFSDPGADQWSATVDYGDGSGAQALTLDASKSFSLDHHYADDGSFTVTVTVSDGTSSSSTSATVTVRDVTPTVNAFSGASINEGGSYTATGSFADAGSGAFTATVDYGDGSGAQPLALAADKSFALSHAYSQDGSFTVTVSVTETGGPTGTNSATVTVANVAPSVNAFAGGTINESGTYSATGSFGDPGADTWSATVDYGDGSGAQALTLSGKSFTLSHQYADNGSYTVTVTVTETTPDAASGSATATVTSLNVAPTVAAFAGATILKGETYTASSSFTDPGADTWTGSVSFGDGSGNFPLSISGNAFSFSHAFNTAGTFTTVATVTDKDNGAGSNSASVVVLSGDQGVASLRASVAALTGLNSGQLNSLLTKLDNASAQLAKGNSNPAVNMLQAFLNELDADVKTGKISAAAADPIRAYALRVIASIGG
ncbi:MAG: non-specific endonuclease [Gemmatimonadetes bacterium]|nr:non-specific endonuclease [Gemmatimonadota bacterium]